MDIIPVLDVKGGIAVHARGGDRAHYRPVRSILHEGADPVGLARAYRDRLVLRSVYLADLDAIGGGAPDLGLVRDLAALSLGVWVDAGARDAGDARPLFEAGATVVVAGLETLRGPGALGRLIAQFGAGRVAFSLDLREGRPVVPAANSWGTADPASIAASAREVGASTMIVLDLARVGAGGGVGTLGLIATLRAGHPSLRIVAGGGVGGTDELRALEAAGASSVLVGSALHEGRIVAP